MSAGPYADLAEILGQLSGRDAEICRTLLESQDPRTTGNAFGIKATSVRMKALNWRRKFLGWKPEAKESSDPLRALGLSRKKLLKKMLEIAEGPGTEGVKLRAVSQLLSATGDGPGKRGSPAVGPTIIVQFQDGTIEDVKRIINGGRVEPTPIENSNKSE